MVITEYKDGMMKRGGTGGGVVQINLKLLTDSLNIGKQIRKYRVITWVRSSPGPSGHISKHLVNIR